MATEITPLQKVREKRKLSQLGLAKQSGVQQATISRAEQGNPMSREAAAALAEFFSGDITELELLYPERYMQPEVAKAS